MKLRSSANLRKVESGLARSLFKSMGYSDSELEGRPLIGIANSWSTLVPGHSNLRELARFVERGIYSAGGTAVEFGVISACDGIANGHDGMRYILPSREIICSSIEIEAQAHRLDGLVLLGSCDKIVPAMLMAAVRLDIPCILVGGGPMLGGDVFDGRKTDATSNDEALGMLRAGRIGEDAVRKVEDVSCPTCGSCAFLGTANTMGCVTEALGMSLTGSALVPAVWTERRQIAYESGVNICRLVERGLSPRAIVTREAIRNAIRVTQAISGSTNAVLHLSAVAHEAEIDMDVVDEFGRLGAGTPQIAKVNPAAKWDMEDFHRAGGVPRVMLELGDLLDVSVSTCTGATLAENLKSYRFLHEPNPEVIKTRDAPFSATGGIAVLRGSLAPNTGITKPGAFAPHLRVFSGSAQVFDCEEDANEAILAGKIQPGNVVVIRYEGPKGGPGMREMYKAMKYLYGRGLNESTALVTDGRFSGTNNGCFVGHISPEAADGGPIALVQDGDRIDIDVPAGSLTLAVSEEELRRRRERWTLPSKDIPRGYLRVYSRLASSADKGAVIL
ncbi:MAG: dihydroxy-acid dehydratase [Synergistaceae bacterium]|jgi:dihydroxy-acid dehydratase|nr:dihydroxy-acid dehydratase [Synergistaceae bacterium]